MGTPILVVGLVFILAILLVGMGVVRRGKRSTAEEVMERMGRFGTREELLSVNEGSGRHEPSKMAQSIEEMFKGRSVADSSAALITRADARVTVGEFLLLRIGAAAGGFLIGFLLASRIAPAFGILLGIVICFVGYVMPSLYLKFKAGRRRKKFVGQLGDTITLMANSLRAEYSLLQTMEMVSRESRDPMATEF